MNTIAKETLGKLADIIPGVLPQEKKGKELISYTAVQPGQLTPCGITGEFAIILRDTPCMEEQFLRPNDILMKRLNPDYVAVSSGFAIPVILSVNLFAIRIRPGKELDTFYLAFLLEKSSLLNRILQLSGKGTTVAAVTASQIAAGVIPLLPLQKQREVGMLWSLSKQKEVLLKEMLRENDRLLRALSEKLYQ